MAPSAVEVETITVPDVSALKLQSLGGQYKEFVAGKFDPAAEAGLKGHAAAKVCNADSDSLVDPSDHPETNDRELSTPTTSQAGTAPRNTPLSSPLSTSSTARMPTPRTRTSFPRASCP